MASVTLLRIMTTERIHRTEKCPVNTMHEHERLEAFSPEIYGPFASNSPTSNRDGGLTTFSSLNFTNYDDCARPSVLCSKCEVIRHYLQNHTAGKRPALGSHTFDVHGTGLEVKTSRHGGCHLCAIISEKLDRHTAEHEDGTPIYRSVEDLAWVRMTWQWGEKTFKIQTNHHSNLAEPRLSARRITGKLYIQQETAD